MTLDIGQLLSDSFGMSDLEVRIRALQKVLKENLSVHLRQLGDEPTKTPLKLLAGYGLGIQCFIFLHLVMQVM
ncbi:unnamed protein product [Timema podura]|uniref:Uncharacterized protein n=1 Tax=Timema podura TaxID=61482 RepID=A0ABN7NNA0_TIMPD|nr:unnamed protein product [Timema podura]